MSFIGKTHTDETKRKISKSRIKYTGKNHPRAGACWTDEQRVKYMLTMEHRKHEDQTMKLFLLKHHQQYIDFQKKQKITIK